MSFTHLHLHTEFSFLDGYGKVKAYVQRAKELGMNAFAVTDHGGLWGWMKAWKACKEANIKFIPGVEFFMDSTTVDKSQRRISWEHLTVLAADQDGYRNLLHLASIAGQRLVRNRPILTYPVLFKHSKGLIVFSGCSSGKIIRLINADNMEMAYRVTQKFKEVFGPDRFFIELQPNPMPAQKKANPILVQLAEKCALSVVVTNDVHYIRREDALYHEVMLCAQMHDRWANPNRWRFTWNGFYLATPTEMRQLFYVNHPTLNKSAINSGFIQVEMLVDQINVTPPIPHSFVLPKVSKNDRITFITALRQGFKERALGSKPNRQAYIDRLRYESKTILDLHLETYFLIVAELMRWARTEMMVGPGRGSSGGSLVCYVLGITEVDPLVHNTLFERFVTPERADLPDIDLDFPASRRGDIIAWLARRYGTTNVSAVATFSEFKGKMALRDMARVFDVPQYEVGKVAPLIVMHSGGDSRADMTVEDAMKEFPEMLTFAKKYPMVVKSAIKLEGITRQIGKHAAGVVIADKPITEYSPTIIKDEFPLTQWDKDDLEVLKMLKIDVLGLNTLDTLSATRDLIHSRRHQDVNLYGLPLTDKAVYAAFNAGETTGVFQFESKPMAVWCRQIGISQFRNVVDLNALYRPGTTRSGLIQKYANRKHGRETWSYPHPYMKRILDDTYGIALYQEQIMLLFNKLANFPWKTSDMVRKVISKSQGLEAFDKYKDAFIKGCGTKGIDQETALKMFEVMRFSGSYGFNLSHAVEYSLISYWCMWLKIHYSLEYFSILITNEEDLDRMRSYVKEAKRLGVEILPPDVNKSSWDYAIEGTALRCGLKHIKGVGPKAAEMVSAKRPYKDMDDLIDKVERRIVNLRVLKALIQSGAMDSLLHGMTMKGLLDNDGLGLKEYIASGKRITHDQGQAIEALHVRLRQKDYTPGDRLSKIAEMLPISIGEHALHRFLPIIKKHPNIHLIETLPWEDGEYWVAGVVTSVASTNVTTIHDGQARVKKLTYFTLDGERDFISCLISGGLRHGEISAAVRTWNGKPVVVKAKLNTERGKYYINDIRLLGVPS